MHLVDTGSVFKIKLGGSETFSLLSHLNTMHNHQGVEGFYFICEAPLSLIQAF